MFIRHSLSALMPLFATLPFSALADYQHGRVCSKKHSSVTTDSALYLTSESITTSYSNAPEATSTDSVIESISTTIPTITLTTTTPILESTSSSTTSSTTSTSTPNPTPSPPSRIDCTPEEAASCREGGCFCSIATTGEAICVLMAQCVGGDFANMSNPTCNTDADCVNMGLRPELGQFEDGRCAWVDSPSVADCEGGRWCVSQSGCIVNPILHPKRELERVFLAARQLKEMRRAQMAQ